MIRQADVVYKRGQNHVTHLSFWGPYHYLGMGEAKHFKFSVLIYTEDYVHTQ